MTGNNPSEGATVRGIPPVGDRVVVHHTYPDLGGEEAHIHILGPVNRRGQGGPVQEHSRSRGHGVGGACNVERVHGGYLHQDTFGDVVDEAVGSGNGELNHITQDEEVLLACGSGGAQRADQVGQRYVNVVVRFQRVAGPLADCGHPLEEGDGLYAQAVVGVDKILLDDVVVTGVLRGDLLQQLRVVLFRNTQEEEERRHLVSGNLRHLGPRVPNCGPLGKVVDSRHDANDQLDILTCVVVQRSEDVFVVVRVASLWQSYPNLHY